MATNFDRWEKDPFFSAAEEIQESTDRMESTYRTWIREKNVVSGIWNSGDLDRDLRTALGTAKWQLEEFQVAVRSSYLSSSEDTSKDRHREFAVAISNKISEVEASLREESSSDGKVTLPWVKLDEGECDELALFLSGASPCRKGITEAVPCDEEKEETSVEEEKKASECSSSSCLSTEWGLQHVNVEKSFGHRRTASACADMEAWKIAVLDDGYCQNIQSKIPPHRVPSVSGFLSTRDSDSKLKWPKNGFRKLKISDFDRAKGNSLLDSSPVHRCSGPCYERIKSHIDCCDGSYRKRLHVWYGAVGRQLQRSQYEILHRRPIQITVSLLFIMFLIVLIAMGASREFRNYMLFWI